MTDIEQIAKQLDLVARRFFDLHLIAQRGAVMARNDQMRGVLQALHDMSTAFDDAHQECTEIIRTVFDGAFARARELDEPVQEWLKEFVAGMLDRMATKLREPVQ